MRRGAAIVLVALAVMLLGCAGTAVWREIDARRLHVYYSSAWGPWPYRALVAAVGLMGVALGAGAVVLWTGTRRER